MSTNPLNHPLWFVELALVPALSALLAIALFSPRDALIVGVLLGLLAGLGLGVGLTLAAVRWTATRSARPIPPPAGLIDPPIEGEWREIAA